MRWIIALAALLVATAQPLMAADVLLPQTRAAYQSQERIELAVTGLAMGEVATVTLAPTAGAALPVTLSCTGAGGATILALPPFSLAPGDYSITVNEVTSETTLQITAGVTDSPMLLSQTSAHDKVRDAAGNFVVSNAFSFGLYDRQGQPAKDLRGRRSQGMQALERAMGLDLPSLIYMYWTGYVTHKPWGSEKSWAEPNMVDAMRLMNHSVGQRLRRYAPNLMAIGTLDEPGLAWGPTPAGGAASGFPNWDEQGWYESRGWTWTDNPSARSADDWRRYMDIRCAILKENNAWAHKDLKRYLPDVPFSTDLYAPHAIMDGTDPLNQQVNDVPSTHVFVDWGTGKLGLIGGLYLEKSHDPLAKVAHAMNGQLFGARVPQPQMSYAYRLMLNSMLAAGLYSNWWLNYGGMSLPELATIHEPVKRYGGLFREMTLEDHDVAVLWSYSEIIGRCQEVTLSEASKAGGEQIKLMIASLPENSAVEENELVLSAYNVGGNYKDQVLAAHQALDRAGYPAHIVHEKTLLDGALKKGGYKVLVIVGQTHAMPADVRAAITAFQAGGGVVVTEPTTTVAFPNAVVAQVDLKDAQFRWAAMFGLAKDKERFKSAREASYYFTNHFMDEMARAAVPGFKAALATTPARQVMVTDSVDLGCERHVGGEGQLVMLINGREELPAIADTEEYMIYNYAPHEATVQLPGLMTNPTGFSRIFNRAKPMTTYLIEGAEWQTVRRIDNPTEPFRLSFLPGEMKLLLAAPSLPDGLKAKANFVGGELEVQVDLKGVDMPWPLIVEIANPEGATVHRVYRATDLKGSFAERFPIGANAPAGNWAVKFTSPVGGLGTTAFATNKASTVVAQPINEAARLMEAPALQAFLATRPAMSIVVGDDPAAAATARQLQTALQQRGLNVDLIPEVSAVQKVRYPRVFDPSIRVYSPSAEKEASPMPADADIASRIQIRSLGDGRVEAVTTDGTPVSGDWFQPKTLVTVIGDFIDLPREGFYETGCVFYVTDKRRLQMINGTVSKVPANAANRQRWSRPWVELRTFVGTDKLTPQLPEAYTTDRHLIVLGDSTSSPLAAALQASELTLQIADEVYPGEGRALVSYLESPFALDRNVILIAAHDAAGLNAGAAAVVAALAK